MRRVLPIALVFCAACSSSQSDVVTYGALIPLTGQLAGSGPDIEQGLILAAERINAAGGVAGKPIRIRIQDTFSDPNRGTPAAQKLIADHGELMAILGPNEDDLARGIIPTVKDGKIALISGGAISTGLDDIDDGDFFFRTCPNALQLAQTLSARMKLDHVQRAGAVFTDSEYGRSFSGELSNAFQSLQGQFVAPGGGYQGPLKIDAKQPSYRDVLSGYAAINPPPDALVLIADPQTGGQLVHDWVLVGSFGRLYFAPSLRSDAFVQTIPPGSANGMLGVSADVGPDSTKFSDAYQQRFGVAPGLDAYFYFDAMALAALATEAAAQANGGKLPDRSVLPQFLRTVSGAPGQVYAWDQLDQALAAVRAGQDIDYAGASGDVDFDSRGNVAGITDIWTVSDNAITEAQ